jgi:hypothetical protein
MSGTAPIVEVTIGGSAAAFVFVAGVADFFWSPKESLTSGIGETQFRLNAIAPI